MRVYVLSNERATWGVVAPSGGGPAVGANGGMRLVLDRGLRDPVRLARLATLLLERDIDLHEPVTDGAQAAGAPPDEAALVGPPRLDGNVLEYWRFTSRPHSLVRVRLDLATLKYEHASASRLARDARGTADPVGTARQELSSPNVYTQLDAVETLRACRDSRASALLVDAMLNARAPRVRAAAARAQMVCRNATSVHELGRVATGDGAHEVREAAVDALASLGGEEARSALERVAAADGDGAVRGAAQRALARMPVNPLQVPPGGGASFTPDRSCRADHECVPAASCCPVPCNPHVINRKDAERDAREVRERCAETKRDCPTGGSCRGHAYICLREVCALVFAGDPDYRRRQ